MYNQPIRIAHVMGKMVSGGVESVVMNYYRNIDKKNVQFDFIVDEDSTYIPRDEIENMGGESYYSPSLSKNLLIYKKIKYGI